MRFALAALPLVIATSICQSVIAADPPKHDCKQPVLPTPPLKQQQANELNAALNTYKDCIQKFSDASNATARAHTTAANNAVAEFNAYTDKVNDLAKATREANEKAAKEAAEKK